jgi:hypothetical protein
MIGIGTASSDGGDCIACSEFKRPWLNGDHERDNECDMQHGPVEGYAGAVLIDKAQSFSKISL